MGFAIVVDVSVARSASESGKPQPEACRRALLALRDNAHRLALSASGRKEWLKKRSEQSPLPYASLFALRWLTDMQSAGRVVEIGLEANSVLRQRCLQALQNNPQTATLVNPVSKDFHLVETALLSDQRVISLDAKIVQHLAQLQDTAEDICRVMWVHPIAHSAEDWLKNGAPAEARLFICVIT